MKLSMKLLVILMLTSSVMVFTSCKKDPTLPTVTTSAFVAQQNGTAEGGGNVTEDGDADVTARGIVYSSTANPAIGGTNTIQVASGSGLGAFTVSLTQLAPGFTYHARAYAINSAGTAYGADVEFDVPL